MMRRLLPALLATCMLVLGACGSGDDDGADGDGSEASESGGGAAADPEAVGTCLDDAGFPTVAQDELLSAQQIEDAATAFDQTDGLTFDASQHSFAGGVRFFESEDAAAEAAAPFEDVAVSVDQLGSALILVEAGSGYEDAVAAAETCLGGS